MGIAEERWIIDVVAICRYQKGCHVKQGSPSTGPRTIKYRATEPAKFQPRHTPVWVHTLLLPILHGGFLEARGKRCVCVCTRARTHNGVCWSKNRLPTCASEKSFPTCAKKRALPAHWGKSPSRRSVEGERLGTADVKDGLGLFSRPLKGRIQKWITITRKYILTKH